MRAIGRFSIFYAVKRQLIVLAADAEKNILGVPWQYMQRSGESLTGSSDSFQLGSDPVAEVTDSVGGHAEQDADGVHDDVVCFALAEAEEILDRLHADGEQDACERREKQLVARPIGQGVR